MKILILLFFLFGSSLSQSISCQYVFRSISGIQQYACSLNIVNPNGFDNFTSVAGEHLPGLSNVNVTAIIRQSGTTRNIPQILCSQFSHVTYMDLSYLIIENADQSAFRGCRNLDWLRLYGNRISQVPENLLTYNTHLQYLDLEYNILETLPENLFENQLELRTLDLGYNPLTSLPSGIFRNLRRLVTLFMRSTRLSALNASWFANLVNLESFYLTNTPLTQPIPANMFENLSNLGLLYLAQNNIRELNPSWFRNTTSLQYLMMYQNSIRSIPADSFENLRHLIFLDLSNNNLNDVSSIAFDNLENLYLISMADNEISRLEPRWFERKPHLSEIFFDFNSISFLPNGIFSSQNSLSFLGLWNNRLRTINRNAFGSLQYLQFANLDENVINSIDERFLTDASSLFWFLVHNNICADEGFYSFPTDLENNMRALEKCTNNFRFVVDTTTEVGSNYNFFTGFNPGMHFEINSDAEVSIALTAFNIAWNPMIEVVFANDTIRIIRNQATEVALVPNQGVFRPGSWNNYRITWARNIILVFEALDEFPFIAHTMQDLIPISFYGLRSQQSQASWTMEPIQIPQGN